MIKKLAIATALSAAALSSAQAGVVVGATFNYTMSSIFVWRQQQN